MPDTSTIIMCGAGAVAAAFAAASIGVGRVLLAADEAFDRWPDAVVPDLSARQPVWMGLDRASGSDLTGLRTSVVIVDEFFQPTERLSKRAARRARGKEAAARRRARLQGRG